MLKKVKSKERQMLHLRHGASPSELICIRHVQLHCSVVCLQLLCPVKHNGNSYMEESWKGLTAATSVIHLPSISCWNLVCCQDASQRPAVGWINYFEEGSLFLPISLLFTPQLWKGLDIYYAHGIQLKFINQMLSGLSEFIVHLQIDCCVHIL